MNSVSTTGVAKNRCALPGVSTESAVTPGLIATLSPDWVTGTEVSAERTVASSTEREKHGPRAAAAMTSTARPKTARVCHRRYSQRRGVSDDRTLTRPPRRLEHPS